MRKAALLVVLLLSFPFAVIADEGKELELRANLIAEKERRLQAEWGLLQVEKKEIQEAIKAFNAKNQKPPKKEQQEKPEVKK